jgi:hypothetical protein
MRRLLEHFFEYLMAFYSRPLCFQLTVVTDSDHSVIGTLEVGDGSIRVVWTSTESIPGSFTATNPEHNSLSGLIRQVLNPC